MATMTLAKTASAIAKARSVLSDALLYGGDTESARSNLNDALEKHREIESRLSEAERATDPDDEAALSNEVELLLTFAQGAAAERLSRFVPALPAEPALDGGLAEALIRARYDDAEVRKQIGEHDAKAQMLRARIDEVRQRRSEILSRRLSGESDEMDARQVALADADIEGLQALLAEHEAARPAEPQAEAHAAAAWRHACELAELKSLLAYAERLQAQLLAAGDELAKRRNAIGGVGSAQLRLKVDPRLRQATMSGIL